MTTLNHEVSTLGWLIIGGMMILIILIILALPYNVTIRSGKRRERRTQSALYTRIRRPGYDQFTSEVLHNVQQELIRTLKVLWKQVGWSWFRAGLEYLKRRFFS